MLSWIYFEETEAARPDVGPFLAGSGVAWVWAVTAALSVLAVKQRQKLAGELDALTRLRRRLKTAAATNRKRFAASLSSAGRIVRPSRVYEPLTSRFSKTG